MDKRLKDFPLIWRFTDAEKYAQLSPEEFRRFQPLTDAESVEAWQRFVFPAAARTSHHLAELSANERIQLPLSPTCVAETEDEGRAFVESVQRTASLEQSSEVLFFWHAQVCVRTDWGLLRDHFDDFCYPSDDSDIAVFPGRSVAFAYIETRCYLLKRGIDDPVFLCESE